MSHITVAGAGGFIGGHLVKHLLDDGHDVRAVDIKPIEEWWQLDARANNWFDVDLSDPNTAHQACNGVDQVYNLACDMGGMGFIANNKLDCMLSVLISTNLLVAAAASRTCERLFYASSACVYPNYLQDITAVAGLKEDQAYPADPEDGYGWEKLFSERMCAHFTQEGALETRVARFHNVFGPYGTWMGGREKAPAAICRKVSEAKTSGVHSIDIWGDGHQTRSFLYIDDAIEGMLRLMASDVIVPLNIGSDYLVSINQLVTMVEHIADVSLERYYDLSAPQGVRGRCSDNTLCKELLKWEPSVPLHVGLQNTYEWVSKTSHQV